MEMQSGLSTRVFGALELCTLNPAEPLGRHLTITYTTHTLSQTYISHVRYYDY